ncbi:MAG TPA: multidrug transporter AcrB, partial [Coxiellaceae bacterium]|nr:multidrug transporter AcrB [Coxiellaceae bacterium]
IVLFTIPLSIFGALLVMFITHSTMNIYSEIGLITLVGLISKHGILMVEFANQLQEAGKNIKEAIIAAATIRLRPILMTTAAMVLGAVPLALASGAGAVSRRQIGWVIIGGMLVGTIFTLFIVPTVYTYIATKKEQTSSS